MERRPRCRCAHRLEQVRGGIREKVEILEDREDAQVRGQACHQPRAPRTRSAGGVDPPASDEIDGGRKQNQANEPPVPRGVERVAGGEQPVLATCVAPDRPVRAEDDGEEEKKSRLYE